MSKFSRIVNANRPRSFRSSPSAGCRTLLSPRTASRSSSAEHAFRSDPPASSAQLPPRILDAQARSRPWRWRPALADGKNAHVGQEGKRKTSPGNERKQKTYWAQARRARPRKVGGRSDLGSTRTQQGRWWLIGRAGSVLNLETSLPRNAQVWIPTGRFWREEQKRLVSGLQKWESNKLVTTRVSLI